MVLGSGLVPSVWWCQPFAGLYFVMTPESSPSFVLLSLILFRHKALHVGVYSIFDSKKKCFLLVELNCED